MEDSKIKTDWLVNNALVAFVGALLLGQYTQTSASDFEWYFGIVIPGLPPIANLVGSVLFLVMAAALATSSAIPPLRRRALALIVSFVPILESLVWIAFTWGFLSTAFRLPEDHVFSAVLVIAGFLFLVFLFVRTLWSIFRWPTNDTNEDDHKTS